MVFWPTLAIGSTSSKGSTKTGISSSKKRVAMASWFHKRCCSMTSADTRIALVTARSDWIAALTVRWLLEHDVRWDLLIMRSAYDWRPSAVMKQEAVGQLRSQGFEPTLAIDDDRRNVAAYEALHIPVSISTRAITTTLAGKSGGGWRHVRCGRERICAC
ncbi:MAG: hypothetical protein R2706_20065 [Acidimicrobiales bacterium]